MLSSKAKNFKKYLLLIVLGAAIFLLAGCVTIKTVPNGGGQATALPLGIFRSEDASTTWLSKSALLNAEGKALTIGDVSVGQIILDPSDHLTLYIATDKGLYYSNDGAESWQQVPLFGTTAINNVAIDYFDKCNIYVTAGQSIYKSSDCLRTWQEIYFDKRAGLQITNVSTERYNKNNVYAANSFGDILKSLDAGKTWQIIKRINNPIRQILIDKDDTRIIYFATESNGLFKTLDGGKTWSDDKAQTDLNKGLDPFFESKTFHYLVQDMTQKNSLLLASKFGLLKSSDGGMTWESIELITPERGANIYSLAVDPKDDKIIFYGTDSTIYKSFDGGKNWATQKSPTSGAANILLIDPQNSKIIYLGAKVIKK
ncbi:MAG: YCF48-related protein [Patescibacteria group bacterium]